jgi:hypothetical protein
MVATSDAPCFVASMGGGDEFAEFGPRAGVSSKHIGWHAVRLIGGTEALDRPCSSCSSCS